MCQYKLDSYLKSFCGEHPEYMNLYATWSLNRKTCSDALKTVVIHYPHFSMHDSSHSEAILAKIEMLLGSRIRNLSPTDAWLILHAAYTHDLGMVLKWEAIEKEWETPRFRNYLSSLTQSADSELRGAAVFLRDFKERNDISPLWPLKTHRYVNRINADYFRGQHARISGRYLYGFGSDLSIDLGHNNMIQPRLLKLLGRICELHTEKPEQVLGLPYQTDGFGPDYAHPRFVAMLLRLGDLLDIDNGRFNTACELASGGLPETSVPHKEKHEATTHILVTPEEIQFSSDCPDSQAYLETRNFVTWLESEVDFLTKYWARITPKDLGGYAPRFESKELFIRGVRDIEGVEGLRFEISQEKAFQIIEGSSIYKDRFVFIREVIQNAMDASKLQLWRDVVSGTYRAWMGDKDCSRLQPYDLDTKIYENYPIGVRLQTLPDGATQITVTDRGTGISVESFKRMCNVGTSNSGSEQLREEIGAMPVWLRPTAGFGVGLQSIFLLTDQFEIDTGTGTEAFHAVAHSHRMGGYLQLQHAEKPFGRGTTLRIVFHMPENFSYSWAGDTENYLSLHFDPMSLENHMGEARVLEAIKSNCGGSMFPIRVSCTEASLPNAEMAEELPAREAQNWPVARGRYRFSLEDDCSRMRLWDMEQAVYGEARLVEDNYVRSRVRFKGIEVDKGTPSVYGRNASVLLDIYGLDTKETISLDRSSMTRQGAGKTARILDEILDVYRECVLERLERSSPEKRAAICGPDRFRPYDFWRSCNAEQRSKIPEDVRNQITENATVLVKNGQGEFEQKEVPVRDCIPFTADTCFLNLHLFRKSDGPDSFDYEKIRSILNSRPEPIPTERILADRYLQSASACYAWRRLWLPVPGQPLLLYTVSLDGKHLICADGAAKNAVLRGLSGAIPGMPYTRFQNRPAKRYAVPGLETYGNLAVKQIPYGIVMPGESGAYAILAPFNREEAEKRTKLSEEDFTAMVLSSPAFPNVVKYVRDHSWREEPPAEEEIVADYRRLIGEYYRAAAGGAGSEDSGQRERAQE